MKVIYHDNYDYVSLEFETINMVEYELLQQIYLRLRKLDNRGRIELLNKLVKND